MKRGHQAENMIERQKCQHPQLTRQPVVLDLRALAHDALRLQQLRRDCRAVIEHELRRAGRAGGHQSDLIGPDGRESRRITGRGQIDTARARPVRQNARRQLLDRGQRRVVQPQVQQQRPKARHQRAKKRRDPQGRIFHADRQKRALLPGKVRMQHTRQAVRQSRQLRIAHALRLPGSKLQRKGRVREFRGKNAENILEPVPGSLQLPQLPFPKNHAVLSPHYRRRPMRPRRGYIRVSYHTRPRTSTNAAFPGGKIPFPRRL